MAISFKPHAGIGICGVLLAAALISGCAAQSRTASLPNPTQAPADASASNPGQQTSATTSASDPGQQTSATTSASAATKREDASAASGGTQLPGQASTAGERGAAIQRRLDQSLAEFDQMLLEEQELLEDQAGHRGAEGSSSAGDTGSAHGAGEGSEKPGSAQEAGPSTPPEQPEPGSDVRSGPSSGPSMPGTGRTAPPPDIPDGSDDDIIARQLREAAEKETDPELRKKLWDEYRKYKKSQTSSPGEKQ
jgi:hypothetical protein